MPVVLSPEPEPLRRNADLSIASILGLCGRFTVESAMHEVELPDGSVHALHFVRAPGDGGYRHRFLRALVDRASRLTLVFDVREAAPALTDELPIAADRDRPGLIKFSLRAIYATAAELQRVVEARALACSWSLIAPKEGAS